MAATAEQRKLVAEAHKLGMDTNLPAIAVQATLLDGVDVDSDEALMMPCVVLEPVPHPILAALLEIGGATRRGRHAWTIGLGEDYTDVPMRVLRDNLAPGLLWPEAVTHNTRGPRDLTDAAYHQIAYQLHNLFAGTPAAFGFDQRRNARLNHQFPADANRFGGVSVSTDTRVAWIKTFTHKLVVPERFPQIQLNLKPAGKQFIEPKPQLATHAVAVLEWLAGEGVTVVDPDPAKPIAQLRKRIATSVVAYPTPGQPAMAEVSVGRKVRSFLPDLAVDEPDEAAAASRGQARAEVVAAALRKAPIVASVMHPGTADVGRMALAEPFADDRLRDYQQEAVGIHLATELGYLNACSPGMGKTVMALTAMRERAKSIRGYRGLVVAEANVRAQWAGEAEKWFPDAQVTTVSSYKDVDTVAQVLEDAADKPVVLVVSYAMLHPVATEHAARADDADRVAEAAEDVADAGGMFELQQSLFGEDLLVLVGSDTAPVPVPAARPRTLGTVLLDTFWHDVVADEAEVLRGTGSKQVTALWALRANSGVAVALTGTPINRGVDDLGRLISWVRNDDRLFRGVKLSDQFNLDVDSELTRLQESMGAVLFRRDTSEISEELPDIKAVVMKLRPTAAEKALADAARMELKRVYDELAAAIAHAEALDPDNPAFATARAALAEARGAWLGGTSLARMASSDPAALLGSASAGAALLAGQGLIAAATQTTGTKRMAVVADVVERVASGEAVIIFTEFATVAKGLIADLDAAGVKVGEVLGGGGAKRDRMIAQFQEGELDVLVATSSGERGLNLQRANTIYHYDLPWTPKGVIQRTGRARRLQSENQHLTVVFPLMEGTIEERVASLVVTRAVESMRALDTARGVDASTTEMGLALGGLAEAIGDTRAGRAQGAQLMEITAALVG